MHDPVDDGLARLAGMTPPSSLDHLEASVFAAIDEDARHRRASRRIGVWSVGAALVLGLVGGTSLDRGTGPGGVIGLAGGGAQAGAIGPIGVDNALAPSTLLLGR